MGVGPIVAVVIVVNVVVVVMHMGAALTRGPLHVMYGLENSLEAAAHFMRVMRLVSGSVGRRR